MNEVINNATSAISDIANKPTTISEFKDVFTIEFLTQAIIFVASIVILFIVYKIVLKIVKKLTKAKLKPQAAMITVKSIKYVFYVLVIIYVLDSFGINLSAILGAAGIFGVAVGFAAQTSFSNIISGFFVLSEKTIQIGDFVTIQEVEGTVHSMDLLSVKILTLDNQLIRIPNETIIKANLINATYYPVRRLQVAVGVSYDTDLEKAKAALERVPSLCEHIVDEPESIVFFDGFGDSSINMKLCVWLKKEDLLAAKNETYIAVKKVFDEENIEIPFNQIVIHEAK